MPKRHYLIYCDESDKKGAHFSNFYGGALVSSDDRQDVERILSEKKTSLNLLKEIKWQYITENYKNKYIEFIDLYFTLIATGRIKVRIMFTQNMFRPRGLTHEHVINEYFILYYFFIKRAFGLSHCNPGSIDRIYISLLLDQIPHNSDSIERFKRYLLRLNSSAAFQHSRVHINQGGISNVNSKEHVILQGLDIHAKRRSIAVTKVKLGKIPMQMLLRAMLVHAFHAALENRVVAFDRVRVDLRARLAVGIAVFLARVIHNAMRGKLFADCFITTRFVGHESAFAI
jgi:hypothetical protein